jgi:predicted ATP-grasp superfamily ATP-dependent carboligase
LSLIKLSLNKEQINFRVLHENTLQLSNAYAMGNSGAILEVLEQDVPLAIEALKEVGVDLESDTTANRFALLNIADRVIDNIPGLRVLEGNARYFVFFVSLAVIIFLTLVSRML